MSALHDRLCFFCSFYSKIEQVSAVLDNTKLNQSTLKVILVELN